PLGSGLTGTSDVHVTSMVVFDEDGDGPIRPLLWVSGSFTSAGGSPASGLARWDGSSWSAPPLSPSISAGVMTTRHSIVSAGEPPALFYSQSPWSAGWVWQYSSGTWTELGEALLGSINALAVFDEDGAGPAEPKLFAGGSFTTTSSGSAVSRI